MSEAWGAADQAHLSALYSSPAPTAAPKTLPWRPTKKRIKGSRLRVAQKAAQTPAWTRGKPREWDGDGFDTETYEGWANLLCTSEDGLYLHEKRGAYRACLDFLLDHSPRLVAWNLRFDAEAVLKHLGEGVLRRLYACESVNVEKYHIEIIPWKMLRIDDGERKCEIFDAAPFFGSRLEVAARRFLGEGKLAVDAASLNRDLRAWLPSKLPRIVEYCKRDARLTNDLCKSVGTRFVKLGGDFRKPYSVAFVAADILMRESRIPKLPEEIVGPAEDAFRGARFECVARGRFDQAHAYDVKSAYPDGLRRVEDARGEWVWGKKPHRDALHAVVRVEATVPPDDYPILAPLPITRRNVTICPVGRFETSVLLATYRRFEHLLKPLESWSFIPKGNVSFPYKDTVERLLAFREESDDLLKDSAKRGNNSIYGKLLNQRNEWKLIPDHSGDHFGSSRVMLDGIPHRRERIRKRGLLYHPLHGGLVTENTRLQIWDACKGHESEVLMIQADGILSKTPFLGKMKAKACGDLGYVVSGDTVVCGSGLYEIRGYARRTRGVMFHSNEGGKGVGKAVRMKGRSWFGILRGVRGEKVTFTDERPAHLNECLRGGKYRSTMGEERSLGLKDANVFLPFVRELNVCRDEKRDWPHIGEARRLLKENFQSTPVRMGGTKK